LRDDFAASDNKGKSESDLGHSRYAHTGNEIRTWLGTTAMRRITLTTRNQEGQVTLV